MKMLYVAPLFLAANGTITLTVSQLAELGVDPSVIGAWEDFAAGVDEDDWAEGFDVNDPSTWAEFGVDMNDPDTWFNALG